MSDFNLAIPVVLRHEGGYVNDPKDPGGATKYGVSLRFLVTLGLQGDFNHDEHVNADDIRAMTVDDAKAIYKSAWWDKFGYGNIVDQCVATKVFDTSVNAGSHQAHKILQRAITALGKPCADDGVLGPHTLELTNGCDAVRLFTELQIMQANFYKSLVDTHPQFQKFLNGWLNRAYDKCI